MSFLAPSIPVLIDPAITAGRQTVAALHALMNGAATFAALKDAVDEIASSAPEDHDVVIHAFDIFITEVSFREPHTLLLRGFDQVVAPFGS